MFEMYFLSVSQSCQQSDNNILSYSKNGVSSQKVKTTAINSE